MRVKACTHHRVPTSMAGFSLIELMLAMFLGLLVISAAAGMFYSSQRMYQTTQALSTVQSNARMAFALIARDVREAGGTGCHSREHALSRALAAFATDGFAHWQDADGRYPAVRGYDRANPVLAASSSQHQVAGTASLNILNHGAVFGIREHQAGSQRMALVESARFDDSGAAIVCAYDGTLQMIAIRRAGAGWVEYANAFAHVFAPNSVVSKLRAHTWYIGEHADGGTALYRVASHMDGLGNRQEMVRHVEDMQITYHLRDEARFRPAANMSGAAWDAVDAVRIELRLGSPEFKADAAQTVTRTLTMTIALRNRLP